MIRVNLLEVVSHEVEEAPSEPTLLPAFQMQAFFGGLIIAGVLVLAAHSFFSGHLDRLNQQMEVEEREAARLSSIQATNNRFSAGLQDINRRIEVLQRLQSGRRGPSQLMAELAATVNAAPDLYLISVTPQAGHITLTGGSNSVSSIATFVGKLQPADGFSDVQFHEYYEDDDKEGRIGFKFSLDFSYVAPAPIKTEPGATASGKQSSTANADQQAGPAEVFRDVAAPNRWAAAVLRPAAPATADQVQRSISRSGGANDSEALGSSARRPASAALSRRLAPILVKLSLPVASDSRVYPVVKPAASAAATQLASTVIKRSIAGSGEQATPAVVNQSGSPVLVLATQSTLKPRTAGTAQPSIDSAEEAHKW